MNNILLIEDDMSINKILAYELRKKGYLVDSLYDGKEAVSKILENDYDLVLIDWMLPYKDGVSIIKEVRQNDYVKPLILLTARSEQEDIIKGLEAGADDYLTKPFLMQELVLRIQHLLQRTYRAELCRSMSGSIQIGSRNILLSDALIQLPDGSTLSLTATERTILQKLIENRGHIVTYDALCEAVWGDGYYGYENSLNVHIRHLREKIGENVGKPQYLITMRGIGYKLTEAR